LPEIDHPATDEDPVVVYEHVMNLCTNVIDKRGVLNDGDTIGVTPRVEMRIRHVWDPNGDTVVESNRV
jgi:hypothetical protein